MIEDDLNKTAVLTHYAFANTPAYLHRKFRDEPSVQYIGRAYCAQELIREAVTREQLADRTPVDVAVAYAALTALSFRPQPEIVRALASWSPVALDWADWYKAELSCPYPATKVTEFAPPSGASPELDMKSKGNLRHF